VERASAILSDTDREGLKREFLAKAGLGDARREIMAGDASTRLYERLHPANGQTLILMDQPPAAESEPAPPDATPQERAAKGYNALTRLAAGRVDAFVAVAAYLKGRGFSAPEVIAFDAPNGLAVLEDLGDDLYANLIGKGADPSPLYEAAVDLQAALQDEAPPAVLETEGARWPLSAYDDLALKTYTELFLDWWPQYASRYTTLPPFPDEARAAFEVACAPIRRIAEENAVVFALRDFHAENLIWLPQRQGLARVGLLDFQDAVKAHPAWDLLHLLQDARRDVPSELEDRMLNRYLAARPMLDRDRFMADYRALAALNAARILGPIFARQVVFFGRPKYIAFMPRTWRYLERNLAHPELAALRTWFDRWIPPQTRPQEPSEEPLS
jgi:aminoglycoside/choline kinase family phosphotransferase